MFLCDIGNSGIRFNQNGKIWSIQKSEFEDFNSMEKIYYICVNEALKEKVAKKENFINLEPYFNVNTSYKGLGVDRQAACMAIQDGIIVDAGSAITVDVMENGVHLGGCILPGIEAYLKSYAQISPKLDIVLKPNVNFNALPQCTADAVSYGIVKSIYNIVEEISQTKKIYFTGGDGKFFSRFFEYSIFDANLVFRGMQRTLLTLQKAK